MKITITPTDEFLGIDPGTGVVLPVRVWEGRTPAGAVCRVLVAGIQVPDDTDPREFDAALKCVTVVEMDMFDPESN